MKSCIKCNKSISLSYSETKVVSCPHCGAVNFIESSSAIKETDIIDFPETLTPIQPGTEITFEGLSYLCTGVFTVVSEYAYKNLWSLMSSGGTYNILAEAFGNYYFINESLSADYRTLEGASINTKLDLEEKNFDVISMDVLKLCAVKGELFFSLFDVHNTVEIEGGNEKGDAALAYVTKNKTALAYVGKIISYDEMQVRNSKF